MELQNIKPQIKIRYRLMGEMWEPNFMNVVYVSENSMVLNDESTKRVIQVKDLMSIMQFELDGPYKGLRPSYHYNILDFPLGKEANEILENV